MDTFEDGSDICGTVDALTTTVFFVNTADNYTINTRDN